MINNSKYEPEVKTKVLRLYLEEGRTKKSLTDEYHLGKGTITYWLQQRRKECQTKAVNHCISEDNNGFFSFRSKFNEVFRKIDSVSMDW